MQCQHLEFKVSFFSVLIRDLEFSKFWTSLFRVFLLFRHINHSFSN